MRNEQNIKDTPISAPKYNACKIPWNWGELSIMPWEYNIPVCKCLMLQILVTCSNPLRSAHHDQRRGLVDRTSAQQLGGWGFKPWLGQAKSL